MKRVKNILPILGLVVLTTLKSIGWMSPYFSKTPEEYLQQLNFKMPLADISKSTYVFDRNTLSRAALIGNFHFSVLAGTLKKSFAGATSFPLPLNNVKCSMIMPSEDVVPSELISSISGMPLSLIEKVEAKKNELLALILVHENDHCNHIPKSFYQYYLVRKADNALPFEISANLKAYEFSKLNNLSKTFKDLFMAYAVVGIFSSKFSHSTALSLYYAQKQRYDMIPTVEQTIEIHRQARSLLKNKDDASKGKYKTLPQLMKLYALANEILQELDETVNPDVRLVFQLFVDGVENFSPVNAEKAKKFTRDNASHIAFDM